MVVGPPVFLKRVLDSNDPVASPLSTSGWEAPRLGYLRVANACRQGQPRNFEFDAVRGCGLPGPLSHTSLELRIWRRSMYSPSGSRELSGPEQGSETKVGNAARHRQGERYVSTW